MGGYFTLGHSLQGLGRFGITNHANWNNPVLIGHRSADGSEASFLGLQVFEGSSPGVFRARAAIQLADGTFVVSPPATNYPSACPESACLFYVLPTRDYAFTYSYDPNGGVNSQGRLHLNLTGNFPYDFVLDLTAAERAIGIHLDAFGIGAPPIGVNLGQNGEVFLDDVIYTAVPEPTAVLLLGLGGLVLRSRRRGGR